MTLLEEVRTPRRFVLPYESPRITVQEALILYGQRYVLDVDRKALDFRLWPVPTWTYQIEGIEIEKCLIASAGASATKIEYELFAVDHDPLPECQLEVCIDHVTTRRFDLSRCTRATVVLPASLD